MPDYQKYESYRDTAIPWLGQIPSQWQLVLLSKVITQVKNKNATLQENNLLSLSYGRIKRKPIDSSGGLLPESFEGYNIIEENDIVLRLTDLQNDHTSLRVGISPEKGIITSAYTTMRPRNSSCAKYLFYLLHTFDIRKGFYGMGSGVRQGLNYDEVKRLQIPWPTVEEQIHISEYLDRETDKINTIISEAKASIEEYKAWKASIIYEAVTKGLDPNAEMKDSGVTWIGKMPETWQLVAAKYVVSINHGTDPKTEGDVPVYGSGSTSFKSCGEFKQGPAVLIGRKGATLHIPHYIEGRYWNVDTAFDVKPKNNHFLLRFYYYLATCFDYKYYISQTTLPSMTQTDYNSMKLPYPTLQEQKAIVSFLDVRCAQLDGLIEEKEALLRDLEAYKKSLIFEVVTGKRRVC